MKKILALALALMLSVCALAETSPMATLFDAAANLAFKTSNVTLGGEAAFTWDGMLFKTMHAAYKQDGYRSYLKYMLDTPKDDGTIYTGGYEVVGLDSTVYSSETYWGNYYTMGCQVPSDTILTAGSQLNAMVSVARTLALTCENLAPYTVSETADGSVYHFTAGDLPEYVDAAAWYLIRDYVFEKYYINIFNEESTDSYTEVWYEDMPELIKRMYFKLYNEEMPDDFNDDEVLSQRYAVAYNWAEQQEYEIASRFEGGCVYIAVDGSYTWYASETELRKAKGLIYTEYADVFKAVRNYYKDVTGSELTTEMLEMMLYSPNPELSDLYQKLFSDCDAYYAAKARETDPDCVRCFVYSDGTVRAFDNMNNYYYTTTKDAIEYGTVFAQLSDLSADVTVDTEGRLTGFAGNVKIACTDRDGFDHTLAIDFSLSAGDYGATSVNSEFNAAEYGWVTYNEYVEAQAQKTVEPATEEGYVDDWDEFVKNAPATIEIMGVTYDTMMDFYK